MSLAKDVQFVETVRILHRLTREPEVFRFRVPIETLPNDSLAQPVKLPGYTESSFHELPLGSQRRRLFPTFPSLAHNRIQWHRRNDTNHVQLGSDGRSSSRQPWSVVARRCERRVLRRGEHEGAIGTRLVPVETLQYTGRFP